MFWNFIEYSSMNVYQNSMRAQSASIRSMNSDGVKCVRNRHRALNGSKFYLYINTVSVSYRFMYLYLI